jgi:hypothetical protein
VYVVKVLQPLRLQPQRAKVPHRHELLRAVVGVYLKKHLTFVRGYYGQFFTAYTGSNRRCQRAIE